MPRTLAEVEAEIEAAKAAGEHAMGTKLRGLRSERSALMAPPEPVEIAVVAERAAASEIPPEDPMTSDEWKFVEHTLASSEIDFGKGQTTGVVKRLYHEIQAKINVWRILRDVMAKLGPGATWPQWATLGRNDATGEKVEPKPAALPPRPPTVIMEPPGGMPMQSRPSRDEILTKVAGGDPAATIRAQMAARVSRGLDEEEDPAP